MVMVYCLNVCLQRVCVLSMYVLFGGLNIWEDRELRTDLHLLLKSNAGLQTSLFWLIFAGESSRQSILFFALDVSTKTEEGIYGSKWLQAKDYVLGYWTVFYALVLTVELSNCLSYWIRMFWVIIFNTPDSWVRLVCLVPHFV